MSAIPGPALLFCPADRPERYAKALARADGVILDLKDAVAPTAKAAARAALAAALNDLDPARMIVRVNAAGTPWHAADLAALRGTPLVAIMLPKATGAADVAALAPHPVVALCETAAGILAAPSIAAAANCVALMWGGEDLVADLGGRSSRRPDGGLRPVVAHARSAVLLAAAAAGCAAVDSVLLAVDDLAALAAEADDAAASGFVAKACIHPGQVETVRRAFASTARELAWAHAVLEAARGQDGVFVLDGRMVDEPVLRHARAVVAAGARNVPEGPA